MHSLFFNFTTVNNLDFCSGSTALSAVLFQEVKDLTTFDKLTKNSVVTI